MQRSDPVFRAKNMVLKGKSDYYVTGIRRGCVSQTQAYVLFGALAKLRIKAIALAIAVRTCDEIEGGRVAQTSAHNG